MQNVTVIKLYKSSIYPTQPIVGYLDTDNNTIVPLNFAIADIKDISKKKGVFSKSITLPGTKNNNILLNNYFDINVKAGTFDINKLQLCSVIQNGVTILDNALLQLVSINKKQLDSSYEDTLTYTVLIKDQTSDFFTSINNKLLTDLDFSELNHIYTGTNVTNSFYNTISNGYKYVMPYNSPDLDNIGADAIFDLIEFAPAIYAQKYWDKIFADSGYSYNWIGLTASDTRFDKLVIPYNGDVIRTSKEESITYTATAQRTTSATYSAIKNSVFMSIFAPTNVDIKTSFSNTYNYQNIIPNIEISDPNSNYDPVTGIYTTPNIPSNQNNVRVDYTIEYETIVQNNSGATVYHVGFYNPQYPDVVSVSQYTYIPSSYRRQIKPLVRLMNNSTVAFSDTLINSTPTYINQKQSFNVGKTTLNFGTMSFSNTITGLTPNNQIYLNTGLSFIDESSTSFYTNTSSFVYDFYPIINPILKYTTLSGGTTPASNVFIQNVIKSVTIKFTCELDGDVSYNVPIKMNKFIPNQIKQSDFVKAVLTMYNLFVEVDKDIPNRLNIISRDDYYDTGKIVDWTKKLVKDKAQDLKFIPEITNKKTILTYKQDEDWANKRYKSATNEIYGQAQYIFDNEYVKDTTTIELLFSPTPVANTSFGAICPIWNGQAPQTNIRILYDGGARTCGQYQIINYYDPVTGASSSVITTNVYPLITHWDNPTNPTFDLNFLPCDFYFRSDNWGSDTNNNLFNLNWRRTMNQINTGRLLTAYFTLSSYDIQNMKLNDKIRIDNSWWVINSIKDYDANSVQPTKVELISIDDEVKIPYIIRNAYTLTKSSPYLSVLNDLATSKQRYSNTIISTGDINVVGRNNYVGDGVSGKVIGNNNSINTGKSLVIGSNNNIDSTSTLVIGDNNNITQNGGNSLIIGNNILATQSGTLYTGNIIMASGSSINSIPITNVIGLWQAGTGANSIQTPGNSALGPNSLAGGGGGSNTIITSNESFAWGNNAQAAGQQSVAFGLDTVAGNNCIVAGDNCTAQSYGVAFGVNATSTNNGSVAMGSAVNALNVNAVSLGYTNTTNGSYGVTLGNNNTSNSMSEVVIGHFAELVSGNSTSFVAADTIFRVGIGTGAGATKDAFRIYKNSAIKLNPVTTASITSPVVGMVAFNSSTNTLNTYNGSSWTNTNGAPIVKKYVAKIKCSTSTATILYNTLGGTPTITYVAQSGTIPAVLTLALTGAFTTTKTIVSWSAATDTGTLDVMAGYIENLTNNYTSINFRSLNGIDYTSSLILHVEITVYP
jgi:hypothetical protein